MKERKGKKGRRSDPKKTFSRPRGRLATTTKKGRFRGGGAAKLGPCLVRQIIVISYFPLSFPPENRSAERRGEKDKRRHKPNWLLPPMWDRDCPSVPSPLLRALSSYPGGQFPLKFSQARTERKRGVFRPTLWQSNIGTWSTKKCHKE